MKDFLTFITIFAISISFGQTAVKKNNISSGGGVATNGNVTVLSTVGEVVIKENTQGTIHISEGFISPNIMTSLGVNEYSQLHGVNAFPNPTVKYVDVNIKDNKQVEVQLINENGQLLIQEKGNAFRLNLEKYKTGIYLLIVKDTKTKQVVTYKIIKA